MTETNKIRVAGLFGYIGSGKSSLVRSFLEIPGFNVIMKEELTYEWFRKSYSDRDPKCYNDVIKEELIKDPLFLMKLSYSKFLPGVINIFESINTPNEAELLLENSESILVGIWRKREEREKAILSGRIKTVTFDEPNSRDSFLSLDSRVNGYMHEGNCLYFMADEIIVNSKDFNYLRNNFIKTLGERWK
ncbi:hypothetical protein ISS08_02520 [Candidatus Pacearchaeota archaeon]|nr:hypothetical protein [Candidatus Pacearchaeota archaeon]